MHRGDCDLNDCRHERFGLQRAVVLEQERNMVTAPHHLAMHCDGPGFAVTVLPAAAYEVNFVATYHVIGFTFERQRGVDAFGSSRRRPFDAEPWRLAFTPAGCDVFSASDRGGEYLVLSVAPDMFAQLALGIDTGQLRQFTNAADPLFTPLASRLRLITMAGAAASSLALDAVVAAAPDRVSALMNPRRQRPHAERRMTPRRLKRILDHFESRLTEDIRLADLASDTGLSECYLARTFRAATGMTLHAALVERRIARARSLIEAASRHGAHASLAEVAAASGFSSHAHMTTVFRRVLGVTPSEWMRTTLRR
jgi:AraC family transcriptional regulator